MIALLSRKKNKRLPVSKVSSVPFKYRSFRNGKKCSYLLLCNKEIL